MCVIEVSIPDAVLDDTRIDQADAANFVKRAVAAELYRKGNVSIGSCAELADMAIEDFMRYLGERKISVFHFDSTEHFDMERARCPK